jgi:hypothetical protein
MSAGRRQERKRKKKFDRKIGMFNSFYPGIEADAVRDRACRQNRVSGEGSGEGWGLNSGLGVGISQDSCHATDYRQSSHLRGSLTYRKKLVHDRNVMPSHS